MNKNAFSIICIQLLLLLFSNDFLMGQVEPQYKSLTTCYYTRDNHDKWEKDSLILEKKVVEEYDGKNKKLGDGNLLSKAVYNTYDNLLSFDSLIYNENGQLAYRNSYSDNKKIIHQSQYFYQNTELSKVEEHDLIDESLQLTEYTTYIYINGEKTKEQKMNPKGIIIDQRIYSYTNGFLTYETFDNGTGIVYKTYNSNGDLLNAGVKDLEGNIQTEQNWKYNDQNKLSEYTEINSEGIVIIKRTYSYTYDENKNVITEEVNEEYDPIFELQNSTIITKYEYWRFDWVSKQTTSIIIHGQPNQTFTTEYKYDKDWLYLTQKTVNDNMGIWSMETYSRVYYE